MQSLSAIALAEHFHIAADSGLGRDNAVCYFRPGFGHKIIPRRKFLFITCIFASTRVFFLAAAAILLSLVCQLQLNVGRSLSLSMKDFFGTKRRCENDQTPTIECVAPVASIAFFILSIVMVFPCDHINWRYFSRKAARFLCYFTQNHVLSTCRLASQFCSRSFSPCQPTDVVFSTLPSPRQATSMASWRHGRLASTSNVENNTSIISHPFHWRNFCRCSLRIYLVAHCRVFSRIAACVRSALLPAARQIDSSSCFIPCPPRALSPPFDEESRALHIAVVQFYTDLVFSFFHMVVSFNLRRASSGFCAIAPFSVLCITWEQRKWLCMKSVVTSVVLALCISTAPLCAKAQVCMQPIICDCLMTNSQSYNLLSGNDVI